MSGGRHRARRKSHTTLESLEKTLKNIWKKEAEFQLMEIVKRDTYAMFIAVARRSI